jgi:uncharacterized protein
MDELGTDFSDVRPTEVVVEATPESKALQETPQVVRLTTPLKELHPAIRSVWRWGAVLGSLVWVPIFGGFCFFLYKVAHLQGWIALLLAIVLVAIVAFVIPLLTVNRQYEAWRYQLREFDLLIRKGIWWKSERYIARDRVQHIDVNSGPFDRRFGLVQVVVYAAGGVGSVGLIPGLKPEEAEWLKEQLLATRAEEA